ncbi:MAG: hypothetical protein U9Q21_02495 [Candidatus Auribacterota bacterium]|nr:hypothetical protein [Candidatus Auribacterota bacterium]
MEASIYNKYLKAAEMIHGGIRDHCCSALGDLGVCRSRFQEMFDPAHDGGFRSVQYGWMRYYSETNDAARLSRELALLFCGFILWDKGE